jgi:uncharacterized protein
MPPGGGYTTTVAQGLALTLLTTPAVLTLGYAGISTFVATRLVYAPPEPVTTTPAALGLDFRAVTLRSRGDGVPLRGWFIPGLRPDGRMTAQRALIVVHGARSNCADPGVLDLSGELARRGFAVLAFDMRGMGASPPAPLSMGYFEQRDVLGAVDFLRCGPLPYPHLGRPRVIGGWGVSMGASTLLLAAAQDTAIRAVIADSAYADILPVLEREIPRRGRLPAVFTPGIVLAAWALYGIDFRSIRPVDVVARIAPRPLFIIHGAADTFIPPSNALALAATADVPHAHVQLWVVPGATHAQGFHVAGKDYVHRVIAFFRTSLGTSAPRPVRRST